MNELSDDALTEETDGRTRRFDPTGVPNLDHLLGGGLPRRALAIVVGPPGSGKTTIANQMAFAAARDGRRVLVFTAFSEPSNKLVEHLRTFSFYQSDMVGERIQFLSLQQFLERGLEATSDEIVRLTRQRRAALVVLDGFRGIRGPDTHPRIAREFLYDVGTRLSVLGATSIITSEADPRDPAFFPEATTADVIIGLHHSLRGVRQFRALEVVKARGASLLPGLHGLRLSSGGANVYPSLESRVARWALGEPDGNDTLESISPPDAYQDRREPFDLPELDRLLDGGLPDRTTTLLVGSLGTGKTLLGLHFALARVRAGAPTLFLGFRENLPQLLRKADAFDLGKELRAAIAPSGNLTLQRWPAVELVPDIVADRLLTAIDRMGAQYVVVDGVAELQHAVMHDTDAARVSDFLTALNEAFQSRGITSLFISEHPKVIASQIDFSTDPISVLAENVLLQQQVQYRGRLHRVLSVVKMRFSAHDYLLREFTIEAPQGIRVLAPFESGEDVLEGITRQQYPTSRGIRSNAVDASGQKVRDPRGDTPPEGMQ